MNNQMIQKASESQRQTLGQEGKMTMQQYIRQMEREVAKALPSVMTPERFTRIVLSALSSNPKLADTTPQSFLGAMMTAAQLGVEPNTPLGQAYLIPYWNSKSRCNECQFQLGYKGLLDLAYRSGMITMIQAQTVYENDEFTYSFGLDPQLRHVPARSNRGAPSYVYAVFKTKDGGCGFEVMSMEDVRAHAQKYSKTYHNGPWQTNFEEMAKKTVLKKALKYAPLKSEFVRGLSADETVKTELSEDMLAVPGSVIETDASEAGAMIARTDQETGEVIESGEQTQL